MTETRFADFTTPDGTPVMHPCGRTGVIDSRQNRDGYRTLRVRYDVPVLRPDSGGRLTHGFAQPHTVRLLDPAEPRQETQCEALLGEVDAIAARSHVCSPPLSFEQIAAAAQFITTAIVANRPPMFATWTEAEIFKSYATQDTWDLIPAYRACRAKQRNRG